MTIEKNICGNEAEMKLIGWLDTQTAPELDEEIKSLGEDVASLTLDLEKLEYISSAGLRLFVAAYKKMNGALTLRNVSDEIMRVIGMTGLDKRFRIE